MELADLIQIGHQEPPLWFLIIGGYAVAVHGHTRATFEGKAMGSPIRALCPAINALLSQLSSLPSARQWGRI